MENHCWYDILEALKSNFGDGFGDGRWPIGEGRRHLTNLSEPQTRIRDNSSGAPPLFNYTQQLIYNVRTKHQIALRLC